MTCPIERGNRTGYAKYGCRCVECRAGHAEYMRWYRFTKRKPK